MALLFAALVALALLSVAASWEQLRRLRAVQRAHRRTRCALARTEERLTATRAALTAATVERDGRESDYYAARGEAARQRHLVSALSGELSALRLRLAQATGPRTVLLWPEDVARATVACEVARSGRALLVPMPGPGPLPTWHVRTGRLGVSWGVA